MHGESPDQIWTLPNSLRELATEIDEDMVKEVLSIFRNDFAERLIVLRSALAAGDRPQICSQAHALKGSSAQVGANALAAACREMEMFAPSAGIDELALLIHRIESHFVAVRGAITSRYGE
jgi:two-component system sensor histidine kinase/response regulator